MRSNFRPRFLIALLAAAGALAGLPALAADATSAAAARTASPAAQSGLARDARASQVIGREVRDPNGAKLGEIKDLVVDLRSGQLRYAVLEFGGVAGLGEKYFAYPVNAFRTAPDRDDLVLTVDRNQLNAAPGFDKARWPGLDGDAYWRDVDRHHGAAGRSAERTGTATTTTAAAGQPRLMRMTELLDKDVNDRQGADAGEIEDVVVNMAQQRVHYVVLDFDKKWSPDDKMLALPLAALSPSTGKGKDADLVLNVPREQLDMKRGFDENAWPDLNSPAYRQDVSGWLDHFPATSRAQEQGR